MLRPMDMHLKRQGLSGVDDDMLDLEARTVGDRLVGAPRPATLGGVTTLSRPSRFRASTRSLTSATRSIGATNTASRTAITAILSSPIAAIIAWPSERSSEVMGSTATTSPEVALPRILGAELPHCVPRAHVRPLHFDRNDDPARGLLHHPMVDRDVLRPAECLGVRPDEQAIDGRFRHRGDDGVEAVGQELPHLVEQRSGLHQENAGIPEEAAAFNIFCGGLGLGFSTNRAIGAAPSANARRRPPRYNRTACSALSACAEGDIAPSACGIRSAPRP